jgi:hypothetical protein
MLTVVIALLYKAWKLFNKEERSFVMKAVLKGALFSAIALSILFVIVNFF